MNRSKWLRDLKILFLDQNRPVRSLLNLTTMFLIFWGLNPESIYYDWKIWAAAAGIWSLLAVILAGPKLTGLFFKHHLWLIAIWPAYTMTLWLMGRGQIHRKFIAVAFMIAVPFFYLKNGLRKDLASMTKIGIFYLTVVASTTIIQMITHPTIARDLAVGRGSGNFRASALLGNFHTIYEAVLLAVALAGLMLLNRPQRNQWSWWSILFLNLFLVVFARYDIALISLGIGFTLLVFLFGSKKIFRKTANQVTKTAWLQELGITSLMYALPGAAILIFQRPINRFIDRMDFNTLAISEKLFNRIWVYLRSLFLYMEFPLFGYGVQPDLSEFMVGQHSDYLDLLAEYGLAGFLVFLVPWVAILLLMRRELHFEHRLIYWISITIFHILFILNPLLEVSSVTMLFLILPGLFILFEPSDVNNALSYEGV